MVSLGFATVWIAASRFPLPRRFAAGGCGVPPLTRLLTRPGALVCRAPLMEQRPAAGCWHRFAACLPVRASLCPHSNVASCIYPLDCARCCRVWFPVGFTQTAVARDISSSSSCVLAPFQIRVYRTLPLGLPVCLTRGFSGCWIWFTRQLPAWITPAGRLLGYSALLITRGNAPCPRCPLLTACYNAVWFALPAARVRSALRCPPPRLRVQRPRLRCTHLTRTSPPACRALLTTSLPLPTFRYPSAPPLWNNVSLPRVGLLSTVLLPVCRSYYCNMCRFGFCCGCGFALPGFHSSATSLTFGHEPLALLACALH